MTEKIKKAQALLLETDTIEEAANELGYTSIHYFCRSFKHKTGLTPTEFKKNEVSNYKKVALTWGNLLPHNILMLRFSLLALSLCCFSARELL